MLWLESAIRFIYRKWTKIFSTFYVATAKKLPILNISAAWFDKSCLDQSPQHGPNSHLRPNILGKISIFFCRIIKSEFWGGWDRLYMKYIYIYIVACHLPRGSKLRWREDMGGKLPSTRESRIGWSLQPIGLQSMWKSDTTPGLPRVQTGHGALEADRARGYLKYNFLSQYRLYFYQKEHGCWTLTLSHML